MIKLINLLKELNIQHKNKLGSGSSFVTYPSKQFPDRVIKKPSNPEHVKEHAEMFSKYPNIFPKVYEVKSNYLVVEKLNQQPIIEYNQKVASLSQKLLTPDNPQLPQPIKEFYLDFPNQQKGKLFINKLYDDFHSEYQGNDNIWDAAALSNEYYFDPNFNINNYSYNPDPDPSNSLWDALEPHFSWLVKQDSNTYDFSKRLYKFYDYLTNNFPEFEYGLDWQGQNMGIDKQGELKMLDF